MNAFKKYLAEFIGTFVLVLFACGTAAMVGCKTDSFDVAYLPLDLSSLQWHTPSETFRVVTSILRFPLLCLSAAE